MRHRRGILKISKFRSQPNNLSKSSFVDCFSTRIVQCPPPRRRHTMSRRVATPLNSLSDQENESESERNRRRHHSKIITQIHETPEVQKRLAFSIAKPSRKSPNSARSAEKLASPITHKSIIKERRTPAERYRTPRTIRVRGLSSNFTVLTERRQYKIFDDYQEVALMKWVNSLLPSDNTSYATPLGVWESSTVLKSRLIAMSRLFLSTCQHKSRSDEPLTNDTLANLRQLLSTGHVRVRSGINLHNNEAQRFQISMLLANSYAAHWLICTLCVVSGKNLGSRFDERRHSAGVAEDDEKSVNILHSVVLTLLDEFIFSGHNDSDLIPAHFNATVLYRVFTLIYLLDISKNNHFHVFDNDAPLFKNKSGIKSSEDIVRKLGNLVIASDGTDLCIRLARQGYALVFSASQVEHQYDLSTQNIVEAYNDGVRFGKLVSVVLQDIPLLRKIHVVDGGVEQKRDQIINDRNFPRALVTLRKYISSNPRLCQGIRFPEPKDASELSSCQTHCKKPLLDALWNVSDLYARIHLLSDRVNLPNGERTNLLQLEIEKQMDSLREMKNRRNDPLHLKQPRFTPGKDLPVFHDTLTSELRKQLMHWVQVVCFHYDVAVTDSTECFRDGVVLCLLLHHYHPQVVKLDDITIVKLFGVREPESDEKELNLIRNNYSVFKNGARQLGGIPMLHLNPKAAVMKKSEIKGDTFGNVMYLLAAYIFKRVVQIPIANQDMGVINMTLQETAEWAEFSVPLETTFATPTSSSRPRRGWNSPRERQATSQPQQTRQVSRNRTPFRAFTPTRSIANSRFSPIRSSSPLSSNPVLAQSQSPIQQPTYDTASVVLAQQAMRSWVTKQQGEFYRKKRHIAACKILQYWRAYRKRRYEARRGSGQFYTETNESASLLVTQVRRMFSKLELDVRACRLVSRVMPQLEETQATLLIQKALRRTMVRRAIGPVRDVFENTSTVTARAKDVGRPSRFNETSESTNVSNSSGFVPLSLSRRPNFAIVGATIAAGGAVLGGLLKIYQAVEDRKNIVFEVLETAHGAFESRMRQRMMENLRNAAAATAGLAAITFRKKKYEQETTERIKELSRDIRSAKDGGKRATQTWEQWQVDPENGSNDDGDIDLVQSEESAHRLSNDVERGLIAAQDLIEREIRDFDEEYGKYAKSIEEEAVKSEADELSKRDMAAARKSAELNLARRAVREGIDRLQRGTRALVEKHRVMENLKQYNSIMDVQNAARSLLSRHHANNLITTAATLQVQIYIRRLVCKQHTQELQAVQERKNLVTDALERAEIAFHSFMHEREMEIDRLAEVAIAGRDGIAASRAIFEQETTKRIEELNQDFRSASAGVMRATETWEQWHMLEEMKNSDNGEVDLLQAEESAHLRLAEAELRLIASKDVIEREVRYLDEAYGKHAKSIEEEVSRSEADELSKRGMAAAREDADLCLARMAEKEAIERVQRNARAMAGRFLVSEITKQHTSAMVVQNACRAISTRNALRTEEKERARVAAEAEERERIVFDVLETAANAFDSAMDQRMLENTRSADAVTAGLAAIALSRETYEHEATQRANELDQDAQGSVADGQRAIEAWQQWQQEDENLYRADEDMDVLLQAEESAHRRMADAELVFAEYLALTNREIEYLNGAYAKRAVSINDEAKVKVEELMLELTAKVEGDEAELELACIAEEEGMSRVQRAARVIFQKFSVCELMKQFSSTMVVQSAYRAFYSRNALRTEQEERARLAAEAQERGRESGREQEAYEDGKENVPVGGKGMHTESARRLAQEVVEGAAVTQAAIRDLTEELAAIARGFEDELANTDDLAARKIPATIRRLSLMLSPGSTAGRLSSSSCLVELNEGLTSTTAKTREESSQAPTPVTPESLTHDAMSLALVVVKGCVERDNQKRHVILALRLLDKLTLPLREIERFVRIGYSFDILVNCVTMCFDIPEVLSGCICLLKKMSADQDQRAFIKSTSKSIPLLVTLRKTLAHRERMIQATEDRAQNSSKQLDELVMRGIPVPRDLYEDVDAVYNNQIRALWKELSDVSAMWAERV